MAHVEISAPDVTLESPTLVEGLPGAGLVGKIAADHLVDAREMTLYGALRCDGIPQVAAYGSDHTAVQAPIRLYADPDADLLVLQSDVPVSPTDAPEFAACLTGWLAAEDVFPLYLSGLPADPDDVPALAGIATGDDAVLDAAGIGPPDQGGIVTGPTGALLAQAETEDLDAVGLIVETQAQFPDPEAARVLLEDGVGPIAGVDVDTTALLDRADEIQAAREELAKRLREADDESTQAKPIRGFQ